MPYKIRFKEWTEDPGVFIAECSDNKERLIISSAINCAFMLPKQLSKTIYIGTPANS